MTEQTHYHIDKLEIVVASVSPFIVKAQRDGLLDIYFPSPKLRERGHKTKIICTVPSLDTLKLLSYHVHKSHKISCIEITRDIPMDNRTSADLYVKKEAGTLRKKWGAGQEYDGRDKEKRFEDGLWSDYTYYFGNKNTFGYKTYARDSKFTGLPVAHSEFTIKSSFLIQKKTGITSVNDLLTTDVEAVFEGLFRKFILQQKINRRKLDKWLKGTDRTLNAMGFCKINNIRTISDLVNFFKQEKKRIRSKRGVRTLWEKRVQKLNYKQLLDDVDPL